MPTYPGSDPALPTSTGWPHGTGSGSKGTKSCIIAISWNSKNTARIAIFYKKFICFCVIIRSENVITWSRVLLKVFRMLRRLYQSMNEEFERLLINSFSFASVRINHSETSETEKCILLHVFSNSRIYEFRGVFFKISKEFQYFIISIWSRLYPWIRTCFFWISSQGVLVMFCLKNVLI